MIKLGSSPRVWGQGFMKERMRRYFRIIPTRVGTSDALAIGQLLPRDHPHACGDKQRSSARCVRQEGSSPRVWGQVVFQLPATKIYRIIPTRVGTRLPFIMINGNWRDHPHACGDKYFESMSGVNGQGSSPRVWGQD